MPVVISSLDPPDRNVTVDVSKHHRPIASLYWLGLFAILALTVLRLAVPSSLKAAWTRLKRRSRRDDRKDYGRNALASPSGFAGFPAGAGGLGQQRLPIWPAMEKSRGISSGAANDLSQEDSPVAGDEARSSPTPLVDDADGAEVGKSTMEGSGWAPSHGGVDSEAARLLGSASTASGLPDFSNPRPFLTRPPPPPPLTPPTLSTSIFTFEDRRPSYAVSIPAELDTVSPVPFIHQPNPDYLGSSSADGPSSSPSTPHRRSYTKTLPISIPTSEAGSQDTISAKDAFAPASFPSSTPLLPPPPPGHNHEALWEAAESQREIDMHGEIISVTDDSGAGWKRHTRVYGGGVCLACMAAGGGGHYGANVPPEHKR